MAGILTVFFFSYFQRCSELHGCRHVWQIHQHQSFNQSSQRRPQGKLSCQWHYEMWPFRQSAAHLRRLSQYFRRILNSNFQLSIWVIELWQVDKKKGQLYQQNTKFPPTKKNDLCEGVYDEKLHLENEDTGHIWIKKPINYLGKWLCIILFCELCFKLVIKNTKHQKKCHSCFLLITKFRNGGRS